VRVEWYEEEGGKRRESRCQEYAQAVAVEVVVEMRRGCRAHARRARQRSCAGGTAPRGRAEVSTGHEVAAPRATLRYRASQRTRGEMAVVKMAAGTVLKVMEMPVGGQCARVV